MLDLNGSKAEFTPFDLGGGIRDSGRRPSLILGYGENVNALLPHCFQFIFHSPGEMLKRHITRKRSLSTGTAKFHWNYQWLCAYYINRSHLSMVKRDGIWINLRKEMSVHFRLLHELMGEDFYKAFPLFTAPAGSAYNCVIPLIMLVKLLERGIVLLDTEGYRKLQEKCKENRNQRGRKKKDDVINDIKHHLFGLKDEEEEWVRMLQRHIDDVELIKGKILEPYVRINMGSARVFEAFTRATNRYIRETEEGVSEQSVMEFSSSMMKELKAINGMKLSIAQFLSVLTSGSTDPSDPKSKPYWIVCQVC